MAERMFDRILIANRGEIAVRVIRACQKLGIETVVAVSEADRDSLPARMATRAVCIGPAPAQQSYLRPELLVTAAKGTGCAAIHPGYGFLSERAAFSRLCAQHGVTFVGPPPDVLAVMGDKLAAIALAREAGVPTVPGSARIESSVDAREFARRHGFPVLVKASAGGGGRGMRVVRSETELAAAVAEAAAEAQAAFGNSALYLERFIERARHIEVQILGDDHGNVLHLGERDCSTQRRCQKLIEESPSPAVDARLRGELADAAVRLARRAKYRGAGTVEFVLDDDTLGWYFLEMNARIQVEHPVTEMVSGRDLLVEQIRIAAGKPISFRQEELTLAGHAIECRINAEDATRNFAPCPGRLAEWEPPIGSGIRVDTHCYPGYTVPPFYDSLLAKLIVHGEDRRHAIDGMTDALARFRASGIATTIPFHRMVLAHEEFRAGRVTTRWVEQAFVGEANEVDRGVAIARRAST